jgi:flagellar FliJ protein
MAFRFPLATVLRVRESEEEREERALQRIQLEMARVRRRMDEQAAAVARADAARAQALKQPVKAGTLQALANERQAALAAIETLRAELVPLEQQRAEQMNLYQAAHRDRQMLTDMEAQQQSTYEQEQVRAQQKRIDDIFATRSQRD